MRIKLGKIKEEIKETQSYNKKDDLCILGEELFLDKHSWDCDWYWGFGYIGNKNLHTHAEVFINELIWSDVEDVFKESIFKNNNDFWVFKDLLKQAYALKKTADVYKYGGNCFIKEGLTDIIKSKKKNEEINKDLEKVLNTLWKFLLKLKNGVDLV